MSQAAGGYPPQGYWGGAIHISSGPAFPPAPNQGDVFYRTDLNELFIYNGTNWVSWDVTQPSYIIYTSAGVTWAKSGTTGNIDFSGVVASTVIQAVLNAVGGAGGGYVFIKEGTYNLNNTLTIWSNTILEGEGRRTILRLGNGVLVGLVGVAREAVLRNRQALLGTGTDYGIQIRNIYIDANKTNQAGMVLSELRGILLNWASQCIVKEVWITDSYGPGLAVYPSNPVGPDVQTESVVDSVFIWNCGGGDPGQLHCGILFSNGTDIPERVTATNLHVWDCDPDGIIVEDNDGGVHISSFSSCGNTRAGISLGGALEAGFTNGLLYDNVYGIYSAGAGERRVTFSNIHAIGNTYGLYCGSTHESNVVGGSFSYNDECGVYLHQLYGWTFNGVTINNNGQGGAPALPYGVYIVHGVYDDNHVFSGCRIGNDPALAATQTYGIYEANGCYGNTVGDCDLTGNITAALRVAPSSAISLGSGNRGGPLLPHNSKGHYFTAVQEAIDDQLGDGIVHVPAGTYNEALVINANDTRLILEGEGRGTTINGGITGYAINISSADDVVIRDLQVRTTPGGGTALDAIIISASDRVKLVRVHINGSDRHGVVITGGSVDCELNECYIDDADDNGVAIDGGNDGTLIVKNRVMNPGGMGIYSNAQVTITANKIYNCGTYGIVIWSTGDDSIIGDNFINTTGNDGIWINVGGDNCVIDGNRIKAWTNEAIDDDGAGTTIGDNNTTV